MSTKPIPDPAALRDALAPRRERLPLTPRGVALRAKTSPGVRRLVPTRLAVVRAERVGAYLWENSTEARMRALGAMEAVLGATALEDRVEEFARRRRSRPRSSPRSSGSLGGLPYSTTNRRSGWRRHMRQVAGCC